MTPAISFPQPTAWALLHAGKRDDRRSWDVDYRGPILLHASLAWDDAAAFDAYRRAKSLGIEPPHWRTLPRGAIVGRAVLVDCIRDDEVRDHRGRFVVAPPSVARYRVLFDDVEACEPVACCGGGGFFEVPDDLAAALRFSQATMPMMAGAIR